METKSDKILLQVLKSLDATIQGFKMSIESNKDLKNLIANSMLKVDELNEKVNKMVVSLDKLNTMISSLKLETDGLSPKAKKALTKIPGINYNIKYEGVYDTAKNSANYPVNI